jgi:tetratricopeptide (TPR) repeat protein
MKRFALALALVSSTLFAQEHTMDMSAPPVALETNLGTHHHKVSTTNAEAQAFFDQGFRYLYAFNHESAVRSFQRATELDPDLAMGYWGAALALGPNINMDVDPDREKQAFAIEQQALAKREHASAVERDLIDALALRYSDKPDADLKKLAGEYAAAMRGLAKKYPDDLDIATLFAESLMDLNPWKFWNPDGTANAGTEEIVSTLESVLKRDPKHVGGNHYYIHAVEASKHPEKALKAADRIAALSPGAGHLVHMPAHIYQRTGNYSGAAIANEKGAEADRAYIAKFGMEGMYAPMYYNHNLSFGAVSHSMQGSYEPAVKMIDEFGANVGPFAKVMPPVEVMAAWPMLVRLRFNRYDEVLATADPATGPASTGLWHFARGAALAATGKADEAEAELKALEAATFSDEPGLLLNTAKALADVAKPLLRGRIAAARGDWAAAVTSYEAAAKAEDALTYDEPPDWILPSREALGAALLRSGKPAAAEAAFRADLERNPSNPRSLFGLASALKAQKKTSAAKKVQAEFRKVWKGNALKIEDL